jgi:hypothetical protein
MRAGESTVADLRVALRLVRRLPAFLRRPLAPADAPDRLARRLAARDRDFLHLVRRGVYARPRSPYARLLRHAGCELGDLERLVRVEGIEGALRALLAAGVYLTVDELKGRRPAVRGTLAVAVGPAELGNPLVGCDLPVRSGGSRSRGTPVGWSLDYIWERAVDLCVAETARGPGRRCHAVWGLPGSGAIAHVLDTSAYTAAPQRWFSQVDPTSPGLPARYRRSADVVRLGGWLAGVPLPRPEFAPPDDPAPVLRWLTDTLAAGASPHMLGYVTAMLGLADAAARRGVDLTGAELSTGGEPITAARLALLRRTGARVLPRYATIEAGLLGVACLEPRAPDDVHVVHDLVGLVQPGPATGPVPPRALMVTSLRPSAPLLLLNASLGDVAALDERACDCPVGEVGWTTRLSDIRSFEKLTGAGVTFHDVDVVPILEEVLPRRFGGGPGQYQLVEEEWPDGRPRLRLLVDPAVGPLQPSAVAEAFLEAAAAASDAARMMVQVWREGGGLVVERRRPLATASGKVLHLHYATPRGSAGPGTGR